ncbi:alpha/beta hydrolase [Nonomuraea sp. FMUSA5-5]|uniref:Alpha/beta hydrolase n=1 Tax=Nonomuraea composti TaxID=2720023 RepID=A0ABX1B5F2_9ACTN|nr:alpha/beta hydrolase [Nonomuraea sp. FMUSA5-5]
MRRGLSRLAAVLMVMVVLLPVSTAVATVPRGRRDVIVWVPCREDPEVECGRLAVPVDWADPDGPTVDLALARRRAKDPRARIGSLLANPGGPGGSGVDDLLRPSGFSEEVQRRFDIVGYDPRGVARSNAVICSASLYREMPPPIMTGQADHDRWTAYTRRLRADCRERTGPLYDHVDSVSVARDMDAIRAALGEEKLTSYGVSYGTLAQQMYAELFPGRVRAMVLDSSMDHTLGVREFQESEAAGVQDAFDAFVAWCGRDAQCVLHGRDVRALWRSLIGRAERGELTYPGGGPLTAHNLRWLGVVLTEGPEWQRLAGVLGALDGGRVPPDLPPQPGGAPPGGVLGAWLKRLLGGDVAELPTATLCEDHDLSVRDHEEYAEVLAAAGRRAPDLGYNPMPMGDLPICQGHPVSNPQHRPRYAGRTPLLLANSLHDPDTPYAWASNVARLLGPNAVLLTYEGWGHGVYGMTGCVTAAIDAYLIALTVPERGVRCPPAPAP